MSGRLLAAGRTVIAWDLAAEALERAVVAGAHSAATPTELGARCPVVVLMLPDSAAVESVVAGHLRDAMRPGAIVVDMSSSDPRSTRRLAADLGERGIVLVDAPVSRGVPAARTGELSIFVGGDDDAVTRVEPLLALLGTDVLRMGGVGCGHATKVLNNLLNAASTAIACEVLLAAVRDGLDPEPFLRAVNASSGRSYATEVKLPQHVLSGRFDSGFTTALMAKDAELGACISDHHGVPAHVAAAVAARWREACHRLGGTSDHTALYSLLADDPGHDGIAAPGSTDSEKRAQR